MRQKCNSQTLTCRPTHNISKPLLHKFAICLFDSKYHHSMKNAEIADERMLLLVQRKIDQGKMQALNQVGFRVFVRKCYHNKFWDAIGFLMNNRQKIGLRTQFSWAIDCVKKFESFQLGNSVKNWRVQNSILLRKQAFRGNNFETNQ